MADPQPSLEEETLKGKSMSEIASDLNNYIQSMVANSELPSIGYSIFTSDKVLYEYVYGNQNLSKALPATQSTLYMANSLTKVITAISVLQLADRGLIDLDGLLSDWIDHPYNPKVTLLNLLDHRSGLPNPSPIGWFHLEPEHPGFDEFSELNRVTSLHPESKFPPGSKAKYSNIGYWHLGFVIERASGQEYSQYVEENILKPLGLNRNDVCFTMPKEDKLALEYQDWLSIMGMLSSSLIDKRLKAGKTGKWRALKPIYHNGNAYGGGFCSLKGLRVIAQDLLSPNPLLLRVDSNSLFIEKALIFCREKEYSLGWKAGGSGGCKYLFKAGGGIGSHGNMRIYPKLGIGTLYLTNTLEISEKGINAYSEKLDRRFLSALAKGPKSGSGRENTPGK